MFDNFYVILLCMVIAIVIIFFVGDQLAKYAGQISELANISTAFVGLLLVAFVTSIPEIVSTFIAVYQKHYALASGGIIGSNAINLAILAFVMLIFINKKASITSSGIFSFMGSLAMLSVVVWALSAFIIAKQTPNIYAVLAVTFVVYVFVMRYSFKLSSDNKVEPGLVEVISDKKPVQAAKAKAIVLFIFFAIFISGLSWLLIWICQRLIVVPIPGHHGKPLGEHFIGTLILALATSIPELATTVQIVRRNMSEMAIENIAGSNLINLMILAIASTIAGTGFWTYVPINTLYVIAVIFISTALICMTGLLKTSKAFSAIVYLLIMGIWIYSLVLIF